MPPVGRKLASSKPVFTRCELLTLLLVLCTGCAGARASGDQVCALEGEFARGAGVGELFSLALQPNGRFSYSLDSDVGPIEEASGTMELVGGEVRFTAGAKAELELGEKSPLLGWWVLVPWDRRCYLVEAAELLRFANYVNGGDEPRRSATGEFLIRRGDWRRSARGLPTLPPPWSQYLLRKPLRGIVTRVLEEEEAEVDIGDAEGLKPGMLLFVQGPDGWFSVVARNVTRASSVVVVTSAWKELLLVGQPVTSRIGNMQ